MDAAPTPLARADVAGSHGEYESDDAQQERDDRRREESEKRSVAERVTARVGQHACAGDGLESSERSLPESRFHGRPLTGRRI